MEEIHKLRAQISNIVQTNFLGIDAGFVPNLKPPSDLQVGVKALSVGIKAHVEIDQSLKTIVNCGFHRSSGG